MTRGVILLLCCVVLCCAQDSVVTRFSEVLCRSDSLCSVRWFGGVSPAAANSSERFDEMFARALARSMDGGVGLREILQPCVQASNCTLETELLLLALLRQSPPCATNEEYVYGHGCVCQDGKECDVDCTQAFIADWWSLSVGVAIMFVLLLAVMVWESRNNKKVSAQLDSIDRQITELHKKRMQEVEPTM